MKSEVWFLELFATKTKELELIPMEGVVKTLCEILPKFETFCACFCLVSWFCSSPPWQSRKKKIGKPVGWHQISSIA